MNRVPYSLLVAGSVLLTTLLSCSSDQPPERMKRTIRIATRPRNLSRLELERPSFNPDGSLIVCSLTERSRAEVYYALLLIDAPAMRPRPLPDLPGAVDGWYGVSWRPSGKEFAFTLVGENKQDFGVWLFDVTKNKARPLVLPDADQFQLFQRPLFSKDGHSLLFLNALDAKLLVCDVATAGVRGLEAIGWTARLGYGWGADADTVWASAGDTPGGGGEVLFRLSLSDGSVDRIAGVKGVSVLVPSPDGRVLACLVEQAESQYDVRLFDIGAASCRKVANADDVAVAWRADSKVLAYENDGRIWVYDRGKDEGRALTPAGAKAANAFWHPKDNTLWCVTGDRRKIARIAEGQLHDVFSVEETEWTTVLAP